MKDELEGSIRIWNIVREWGPKLPRLREDECSSLVVPHIVILIYSWNGCTNPQSCAFLRLQSQGKKCHYCLLPQGS
jgi:hypothetical protein